ncbi:sugar O-acetyltransferase [Pontibacter qinzhouensis]|uniref:Acetyltransferase n=1 Tax=Pontibacter qinzhouensis TaxID=2603253 RepID=A0A5C8K3N1_9BACT|nr:sugar O-acetyltransferase [Pontibacter qinzhouensis]TXK44271.1 sugar O-acetyltransferase [Pontibacter qinzhouensis]
MKSERQKMLDGELYVGADPELVEMRRRTRELLVQYNQTAFDNETGKRAVLQQLLGAFGEKIEIQAPFYCDYGNHIFAGENLYMNFNCVILDCAAVTIGANVMMGPNVSIYTAYHPVIASERIKGPELASPITIGDNVWLGGNVVVCPGVTIGHNTTIGAGSVVTKSIPDNVFAAGNPCRVIKELPA